MSARERSSARMWGLVFLLAICVVIAAAVVGAWVMFR